MRIFNKISDLTLFIQGAKSQGKTIGFVPTMGALHAGHLHLVTEAKKKADIVIASIFVNPTQFGPNEDFAKYPRKQEEDIEKLNSANCDAVFIPEVDEVYPSTSRHTGESRYPEVPIHDWIPASAGMTNYGIEKYFNPLCGAFRPGHFAGVVQVVKRLFEIVTPDYAFFGEKDFQQLFIIKKMVESIQSSLRGANGTKQSRKEINSKLDYFANARNYDFWNNIKIIGVPTVRDEYGLALSSRNAYLSAGELNIARKLNVFLKEKLEGFKYNSNRHTGGSRYPEVPVHDWIPASAGMTQELLNLGFTKVDYIEFRNSLTLEPESVYSNQTRIFAAAYIGKTRLIDNVIASEL